MVIFGLVFLVYFFKLSVENGFQKQEKYIILAQTTCQCIIEISLSLLWKKISVPKWNLQKSVRKLG